MDCISDEPLKHFTTLKELECKHCPKIQNEGLCAAVQMCEYLEKICIFDRKRSIYLDIDFLKSTIDVLKSRNNKNHLEVCINDCIVRIKPNESSNDSVDHLLLFEIFDKKKNPYFSTSDEERLLSVMHNI